MAGEENSVAGVEAGGAVGGRAFLFPGFPRRLHQRRADA